MRMEKGTVSLKYLDQKKKKSMVEQFSNIFDIYYQHVGYKNIHSQ